MALCVVIVCLMSMSVLWMRWGHRWKFVHVAFLAPGEFVLRARKSRVLASSLRLALGAHDVHVVVGKLSLQCVDCRRRFIEWQIECGFAAVNRTKCLQLMRVLGGRDGRILSLLGFTVYPVIARGVWGAGSKVVAFSPGVRTAFGLSDWALG
eukprot:414937-Amphidinium_carterae.1